MDVFDKVKTGPLNTTTCTSVAIQDPTREIYWKSDMVETPPVAND